MPISGYTATLNLAKFAPNSRGWDGDVNNNFDLIDAAFVSSKSTAWITSGVFDAARIPLAVAATTPGAVMPDGSFTYNAGTGALSLAPANIVAILGYTPENAANKGVANGYASLDANGLVPTAQIPPIALTTGQVVADDTARLALTAAQVQPGDFVKVTATGRVWVLAAADPSVAGNWIEIADDNAVQSVNGQTGTTILLTTDNVGEGATNLYFTNARVQAVVTKAYIESVLTGTIDSHDHDDRYLKLAGGTMTGDIAMGSQNLTSGTNLIGFNVGGAGAEVGVQLAVSSHWAVLAGEQVKLRTGAYMDALGVERMLYTNGVASKFALQAGGNFQYQVSNNVSAAVGDAVSWDVGSGFSYDNSTQMLKANGFAIPYGSIIRDFSHNGLGVSAQNAISFLVTGTGQIGYFDPSGLILSTGTYQGNAGGLTNIPGANITGAIPAASLGNGSSLFVSLAGAVMTGFLTLSGDPTANLHAATKQYVDNGLAAKANLAGATFMGAVLLAADPTAGLGAATKQYVDNGLALYLPVAGGTMTGTLILAADPVNANDAATKHYVDSQIGANAGVSTIRFGAAGTVMNGAVTVLAAHITAALGYTAENVANKGVAGGYASLDANGLVPTAQIPPIALTTGQVVADQTARLALTAAQVQPGDFVKQTDTGVVYVLAAADPSVAGNWIEIASDNAVLTVNGHSGTTVLLTTDDIGEGATHLYFTNARVQAFADTRYLQLAGGTLTGALILAADPATALGAATKQYVDGQITAFAGVTSFNTRTGAITLLGTDVNTALGYTAANAAALDGSAVTTGTVAEPRISVSISRRSDKPALSFIADGPLAGWVGSNVTDYFVNLGSAKTWSELVITSASMALGDSVTIDILKVTANGGVGASIFQTNAKPVLNGTGTRGDGHLDWATVAAAAMDSATLANGHAYVLKITAASANIEDLRVEFYEAL